MTTNQLLQYQRIIKDKNWNTNSLLKYVEKKLFNLFTNLNKDEIDLTLDLLKDFTWIGQNQYDKKILEIFGNLSKDIPKNIKKFYFFPIVSPNDANKLKSGIALIYPIIGIINYIDELDHINKNADNAITSYSDLKKLSLKDDDLLILVDDFIGSGNTLKKCVDKIKEIGINTDKLIICSIAIQKGGLELINNNNIKVYYSHIEKKGISDNFEGSQQEDKLTKMNNLELKLRYKKNFRLGYEQSEALISMIRTPNNTFPIFWHDYQKDKSNQKAPFPR